MPEKIDADHVVVHIDNLLRGVPSASSEPSIFRVGHHLRRINPKAYDPEIIAIGPFHRGKGRLKVMEQHKIRYLKLLLEKRKESSVKRYAIAMRDLEDRARKCYAGPVSLNQNEFVEMLLLDGCFILEFLRKFQFKQLRDDDDTIFHYGHTQSQLFHDLLLFENQLPFFILDRLFNMTKTGNRDIDDINQLIWPLLQNGIFKMKCFPQVPKVHHLLGIVHGLQCSSFLPSRLDSASETQSNERMVNIHSATELHEAGIKFKKSEGDSLFHVEFKNKVLLIPVWEISDVTESLFRNLIAYEYYLRGNHQNYVTDYVFFMHCLIHSSQDAKLLRCSGIISNFLGGDEKIYNLISELGKNSLISEMFSYADVFDLVNRHCIHRRNKWMAVLRRDYFNSPWALISVLGAITLLVLTVTQTAYAILSYSHDRGRGS